MKEGINRRFLVTPNGTLDGLGCDPAVDIGREMLVQPHLGSDTITVYDPLFSEPYTIGDGSTYKDPAIDTFVKTAFWSNLPTMSIRQLQDTEITAHEPGAPRWSVGQHMLSATRVALQVGASPEEIMYYAIHDAAKCIGAHRTDDLFQGRGVETFHDHALERLLISSGFLGRMATAGLLDTKGELKGFGIAPAHLENASPPGSAARHPSKSGFLDYERLQFRTHEGMLYCFDVKTARQIIACAKMVETGVPEFGNQIIVWDTDATEALTIAGTRMATENWGDWLSATNDQLINELIKYVHSINSIEGGEINQLSPYDSVYELEEVWMDRLYRIARHNPAVAGMLKIITVTAAYNRQTHEQLNDTNNRYQGPKLPEWMYFKPLVFNDSQQQFEVRDRGKLLSIQMKSGKQRPFDPVVYDEKQGFQRISKVRPAVGRFIAEQTQWVDTSYEMLIDLSHKELGLTAKQRQAIARVFTVNESTWDKTLARTALITGEGDSDRANFAERYARISQQYLMIGSVAFSDKQLE